MVTGSGNPRLTAGLFLITLTTLAHELLLTRIFSVSMSYHFAFLAISIAMFGGTVGAVAVYLFPDRFPAAATERRMAQAALTFAVTIVVSFLTHLSLPFVTDLSLVTLYANGLNFVVVALPFVFAGITVCLALTRFPRHIGRLYAADLSGAACGGLALLALLRVLDAPSAVLALAGLAALAAWVLAPRGDRALRRAALAVAVLLAIAAAGHGVLAARQLPVLRLTWVKGRLEGRPFWEKWNALSRVRVYGHPEQLQEPFGWGMSSVYPSGKRIRQLLLNIDADAATILTRFDGDLGEVDHLRYDVVNLAHHVSGGGGRVLVIGAGGGRDVLSALVFGQREVVAAEINGDIIAAVNGRFGDFTGHLDRLPGVRFVHDEARSWATRTADRFDVIQLALIDTYAATAAGAFAFAENGLYTVEGWRLFLDRLTPHGVLSFSRWYELSGPAEAYRMVVLAGEALRSRGVVDPSAHVLLALRPARAGEEAVPSTIVIGAAPLTGEQVERFERAAAELAFEVLLSPRRTPDPVLADLLAGRPAGPAALDLTAPTDDRPYFFQFLRLSQAVDRSVLADPSLRRHFKSVAILFALLVTATVLSALFILTPLALRADRGALAEGRWLLVYFFAIGLGFMLVEMAQLQRLILLLGHPTYGFTVVLTGLLLASGAGSWLARGASADPTGAGSSRGSGVGHGRFPRALLALPLVLAATGWLTPVLIRGFAGATTPVRIAAALAMLVPAGLLMGAAVPHGLGLASRAPRLAPWLWGLNGAASVTGSILAIAGALAQGISRVFLAGIVCYVGALVALALARRSLGTGGRGA